MMRTYMALLLLPCLLAGPASAEWLAAVEHGTNSVILEMELYTADGTGCLNDSDLTGNTGLQIEVSSDAAGVIDTYTVASSEIENITTIGTYAAPTSSKVRIEQIAANSCVYEMHLADAVYDTADASVLKIAFRGDSTLLPIVHTVDLTPVSASNLVAALLDTSCAGYASDNDVGYQICTALDAVLTDTGTTLDGKTNSLLSATARIALFAGDVDTVTSQTQLVESGDAPVADDTYIGMEFCVTDVGATPEETHCALVLDYVASTGTFTIAAGKVKFTIAAGDAYYIRPAGAGARVGGP